MFIFCRVFIDFEFIKQWPVYAFMVQQEKLKQMPNFKQFANILSLVLLEQVFYAD